MKIQIHDIRPYGKNAKKHPDSQLQQLGAIVKEVGWRMPILVNQEGVIIAGHGRWMTWLRFQDEVKPVWIIDDKGQTVHGEAEKTPMTPEQEKSYRLADNKLNESDWDMELVIAELKELPMNLLDLTGFNRRLVLDLNDKDDVVPSTPAKPKSELGDVYQLGPHKVICGDSTEQATYVKLMGEIKADMVFTDPPYNVDYHGKGKGTSEGAILNDKMNVAKFREFLIKAFKQVRENIKAGGGLYVFHSSSSQSIFQEAMAANEIEIKNQLIWNKPVASMGWGDYRWKHEPFFYAGVRGTSVNFYGDRTHTTVLDFQKSDAQLMNWIRKEREAEKAGKTTIWTMKREPLKEYVHPTQKPVELVMYALSNSSKVDDIVLDPFLGSGSTLIACQKTNRIAYGMELDPKFVDVIVQRYVDFTGNKNIIKNGEKITW